MQSSSPYQHIPSTSTYEVRIIENVRSFARRRHGYGIEAKVDVSSMAVKAARRWIGFNNPSSWE